jgi:uncharacterized protein YutE (UPF0331/DUF86 family)
MATIDKVIDMQGQGMSDTDIIDNLRNEGISTKEISDSLSQAKIKMAVSQEDTSTNGYQESSQDNSQQQETQQPQEYSQEPQYSGYSEQPQSYQGQGAYLEQSQMSVETISEIVDRILSEKLKEVTSKIKLISDFKSRTEEEILELKERVKRIELSMDNLQRAVITKIGEVSQSSTLIHKDLDNLHGTVSKLMNPLVDNYNELKKLNSK